MAECYPQGCPPCTEEISFPENPINGQRECFHIGKDPNTNEDILKCWVYDECVPGWRAEGPAVAPISFKGQIDLTKTETENGITVKEAGDYYIVAVSSDDILNPDGSVKESAQQFLTREWPSLQHQVNTGAFILWTGTEWVEIPRPCGEEADCALDATPSPDNREAGVVTIASVEEVEEGTNKCNPVTPYTLKKSLATAENFKIIWEFEATEKYVPVDTKLLNLTVMASAYSGTGDAEMPGLGQWVFKYYDITAGAIGSGNEVEMDPIVINSQQGGYAYENSFVNSFDITPVTGTRTLKVVGTFYEVGGTSTTVETPDLTVKYSNAMVITTQPVDIDTQSAEGPFSSSVVVEPFSADLPFDATKLSYQWLVWNIDIQAADDPDLNYEFSGFETDTLTAKRTSTGAETVQIRCEVRYGDDHPVFEINYLENGELVIVDGPSARLSNRARAHDAEVVNDWVLSEPALLKGPTERIIKETTRTVVEQKTVTIREVAPKAGSNVSYGGSRQGTILYFDKSGNFSGSARTHVPGVQTVRARRGKPDGSDRRLKKNIMSIGEFYASN